MGYGFGRGSFNISPAQYAAAVTRVQNAPLSAITADFEAVKQFGRAVDGTLLEILQHYTSRGTSHNSVRGTLLQAVGQAMLTARFCVTCNTGAYG